MLIYRKSELPSFLCQLPLIHKWRALMAPVDEDIERLRDYAAGRKGVEEPLSSYCFKVAIDLPDLDQVEADMTAGRFKSTATMGFDVFGWHLVDVARILRYDPDENDIARKLRDEDFDRDFVELAYSPKLQTARIRALTTPVSILPFIADWERFDALSQASDPLLRRRSTNVDKTWHLTAQERKAIEVEERRLFELYRAEQRHRKLRMAKATAANCGSVTTRLREQILRADKYTDLFTGAAAPEIHVDVHHIIPRSMIERLDLPREMLSAPYNLITVDACLNRAKGAYLRREDVELYFVRFADAAHRNYPILQYLSRIKEMQAGFIK